MRPRASRVKTGEMETENAVRASGGAVEGRRGFTLIEVIGAVVVFSAGVLMVAHLTGTLTLQMEWSAAKSEVVALAQERMEYLEDQPYDDVPVGTSADTLEIRGRDFIRTVTVTQYSPLTREISVRVVPDQPPGPRFSAVTYLNRSW